MGQVALVKGSLGYPPQGLCSVSHIPSNVRGEFLRNLTVGAPNVRLPFKVCVDEVTRNLLSSTMKDIEVIVNGTTVSGLKVNIVSRESQEKATISKYNFYVSNFDNDLG